MKTQTEASILRQRFKTGNRLNLTMSLVGKVLGSIMTISMSLILTYTVEAMEYKSARKFLLALLMVAVCLAANLSNGLIRKKFQNAYLRRP